MSHALLAHIERTAAFPRAAQHPGARGGKDEMDASTTAEHTDNSPPGGKADAGKPPTVGARRTGASRSRRAIAATAALLALAIAVPVGVQLADDEPAQRPPRSEQRTGPVDAAEALRQARQTGKDVQITARDTSNSTTWAQPDGLLRIRTHSDTIRAKVGDEWKPIDTTLERVEGGYAPKAVNDPLLFSAGSKEPGGDRASRVSARAALAKVTSTADGGDGEDWTELVRLNTGGHDIVVSWPGPLPAPVVDGARALYENVRPDVDLLLTARDSGFSHVLVVHTREAAEDPLVTDLSYRLTSADLTFVLDKESKAVSARDSTGQEVAAAPTPYMWDSAGTEIGRAHV